MDCIVGQTFQPPLPQLDHYRPRIHFQGIFSIEKKVKDTLLILPLVFLGGVLGLRESQKARPSMGSSFRLRSLEVGEVWKGRL